MKHTLVGDVHGKVEHVREALSRDGHVIFVGDFMDSFDRSSAEMLTCLQLVTEAIKLGKAEAIFGNHELSYELPKVHRCSGYSQANENAYQQVAPLVRSLFKPYLLLGSVLITHAGLTRQIWDKHKLSRGKLSSRLQLWWKNQRSPAHWIGRYRGGLNPVGGIFWCDFNAEFTPIPGLTQIFGHTAGSAIRKVEDSYCIDCLDYRGDFLELDL